MRGARPANLQHAGVARSEQVWLLRLGSAPSRGCVRDQEAWPIVSGVLVQAVLRREDRCSRVHCILHEVQGCRPCTTSAAINTGGPYPFTFVVVVAGGGREPTPLRCHTSKDRGVNSMGSDATLQNVGEIRARLQYGKVHKSNDAICEVTGRRHRVSPCRSAY